MTRLFNRFSNRVAHLSGTVWAFLFALLSILVWAGFGPYFGWSDTHQLVINTFTTLITYIMVFVIQNTQNRQEKAMQEKLNEIIRSIDAARNEYIGIENSDQNSD